MVKVIKRAKKAKNFLQNFFVKENLPLITLLVFAIYVIVSVTISHVVFLIPVVAACLMVIMEALLVACLNKIPLWIHGLVFIAQIVAGIMAGHLGYMILMSFVYVIGLAFLFIWAHHE